MSSASSAEPVVVVGVGLLSMVVVAACIFVYWDVKRGQHTIHTLLTYLGLGCLLLNQLLNVVRYLFIDNPTVYLAAPMVTIPVGCLGSSICIGKGVQRLRALHSVLEWAETSYHILYPLTLVLAVATIVPATALTVFTTLGSLWSRKLAILFVTGWQGVALLIETFVTVTFLMAIYRVRYVSNATKGPKGDPGADTGPSVITTGASKQRFLRHSLMLIPPLLVAYVCSALFALSLEPIVQNPANTVGYASFALFLTMVNRIVYEVFPHNTSSSNGGKPRPSKTAQSRSKDARGQP